MSVQRLRHAAGVAELHRDSWGMPAIQAEHEEAGWFAVGYAQAEDHLEELLAHWLLARGELSRLFGASTVRRDEQQRQWRVLEHARQDLAFLPSHLRRRQQAFVAGVQHYMDRHREQVPTWAPPLEPALTMARLRTLVWPWVIDDALQALEDAGIGGLAVDAGAAIGFERGSNAWAVAGSRTVDGSALLLADPHLPLGGLLDEHGEPRLEAVSTGAQFLSFEFAFDAGDLTFVGFAPVGLATPGLATTPRTGWGLTTGQPNCSDAYRIATRDGGRHYDLDGDPREVEQRVEDIEVRGERPVRVALESVRVNGRFAPVVAREGADAFVVSTPYVDCVWRTEVQLDAMLRADDLDEFLEAFDHEGLFPQNVVVADCHGRIGYVRAGRVPIRPPSIAVGSILDGNTRSTEWLGIHPPKDLLRVIDPPGGFLQACNTAPDTVTGGLEPLSWPQTPDYLFNDEAGRLNSRGERIRDLLADGRPVDPAAALAAATDDVWVDTPLWLSALASATEAAADSDDVEVERMHAALLGFDGRAAADSTVALWWQYWREALLREEPDAATLCDRVEAGEFDADVAAWVVRGLARGRDRLRADIGRVDACYGDVLRVGPPSASAPGSAGTFQRRPPAPTDRKVKLMSPLRVIGHRQVVDATGRRQAVFGGPALRLSHLRPDEVVTHVAQLDGQASRPGHPHRADQAHLVADRRLRRVELSPASWRAAAVAPTTPTFDAQDQRTSTGA